MYKQISHLVDPLLDVKSNRLLDNMTQAEVRRSTIYLLGILILIGLVVIFMQIFGPDSPGFGSFGLNITWGVFYLAAFVTVYFFDISKVWCVRLSLLIILGEGLLAIVRWIVYKDPSPGDATIIGVMIGLTLGAVFLPWSPRQTLTISLLWIIGAVSSVFVNQHADDFSISAAIFVYVVITVPGTMISFFRMSRFQDQFDLHFIQTQYEGVREELQAAKNIHERGFPKPKSSGDIRFTYTYRPMSQMGGDSIFASIVRPGDTQSPVTLVLFDVTGHGLSAALTANRLQGELMRIMGEDPTINPAELLTKLDRYVCLTLADSAVLVSAVAINANPAEQTITVANAGHPAAILRSARGSIHLFESTAPVLGVGMGQDLNPTNEQSPFLLGDSLIAYTDGVSEAINKSGEMYTTNGVIRTLEEDWIELAQRWPEKILIDVEKLRAGSALDDILIVELYRA